MALIQFTKNYTDHSNGQGFQFEFHCDKCGQAFQTQALLNVHRRTAHRTRA